ncbi:MAG TPA: septum formation initiator family protein, partial [Flavobacteriales bacterium]|nr:septum formation initiator family protein [Flavobacteriales bacterium]
SIHFRSDQIVSGMAINFFALGLTGFFFVDVYGPEGTPEGIPTVPDVHLAFLDGVPFLGDAISTLNLLVWVALFDRNDLWTTWKNHRELGRMEEQQEWYAAEIERTKEQLHELSSDTTLLEKFARERYLMKRDNEDIFVLVPAKKD